MLHTPVIACSHQSCSLLQGLKKEMDIDVRVIGVTNSSEMLLSEQGLSLTDWEKQFERWAQTSQPHILCLLYVLKGLGRQRAAWHLQSSGGSTGQVAVVDHATWHFAPKALSRHA